MTLHRRIVNKIRRNYNRLYVKSIAAIKGLNSQNYWNARFAANWEQDNGSQQTALFAVGFTLLDRQFDVKTVLDYGCGCGDSLPVLKIKFPQSKLFYYDFSNVAMLKAQKRYGKIASPFTFQSGLKFDLVYCSNVVEHIDDPVKFCRNLLELSEKYVVIQAPYNERHDDGSLLTRERPIDEHINTINESLIENELKNCADWTVAFANVPIAWDKGPQIFFIGCKKNKR